MSEIEIKMFCLKCHHDKMQNNPPDAKLVIDRSQMFERMITEYCKQNQAITKEKLEAAVKKYDEGLWDRGDYNSDVLVEFLAKELGL